MMPKNLYGLIHPWILYLIFKIRKRCCSIVMSKTFVLDIDNTSDHQPVIVKLHYSIPDVLHGQHCLNSTTKQKIHWSNISQETVNVRYVDPLLSDISELNIPSSIELTALTETITSLLLKNSLSLVSPLPFCNKKRKHGIYVSLPDEVKDSRTLCKEAFASWKEIELSVESLSMTSIEQNEGIITRLCANSSINSNVIELRNLQCCRF